MLNENGLVLLKDEIPGTTFTQACYFTEAMKAIASINPGYCLGALEMLQ